MYLESKATIEAGACEVYNPSLTERLTRDRDNLAARVKDIDEALADLEKNPEVQRVLNLVQKVRSL